jgi:hypothetical protein
VAKAKVGLYLRYRQEGKQSPYRPVCWDAKKRLRPFWCMVRGVEEHHPEGSYHLRYGVNGKQVWEPVGGADPIALRNSRIHDLNNPKDSSSQRLVETHTAVEVPVPRAAKDRLTLDDAIRIYLTTGKAAQKDWRKHTLQCQETARGLRKGGPRSGENQSRVDQISQGFLRLLQPCPRHAHGEQFARPCRRPLCWAEHQTGYLGHRGLAHHRPLRTASRVPALERYRSTLHPEIRGEG